MREGLPRTLYSIGHSNHPIETFLGLLRQHAIEVLVDVRSHPSAKYAVHFTARPLKEALAEAGVKYLFLGKELGGQPDDRRFYDADGRVVYARMAEWPPFIEAVERLERGAAAHRVAIMCGEENPAHCHRRLLIGRVLAARGSEVLHIRGDGRVQTEADLDREETGGQGDLFADQEDAATWRRSIPLGSPGRAPKPSSEP